MQPRAQSSNWHHILAFLSLAAGLGLACGVALGGIALLLAAPAYGAQASDNAEGALMLHVRQANGDSAGEECIQASLVSTDVAFQIDPRRIQPGPL